MPIQPLISHFEQYISLNQEEKGALIQKATIRRIKRRQFVLQEGDVCKHYTFVVAGCFKMYGVDEKGTEHNIQFSIENDWITDIGSFHAEKPSQLYIEAIEPGQVIQIEKPDLIFFYENHPKFNRIFRVILENHYIELQNRLLQTISISASERYLAFLDNYPHLSNRLPNTQIASYLGITPEFLSKIRKELAR
jgi:CRP-like cAMP-binding protein